jgi:MFS family permease
LTFKVKHYEWVVVAGCFACCLSYGIFYSLGVFFTTLEGYFGWNATLVSSIHSVHLMVFIFSTFFMGWLTDRYGPRLPVILSAILVGTGFCLLSTVNSFSRFLLLYIVASLGAGVIYSLPTATVQRWFPERSGLALGIVIGGTGVGILLYATLSQHLIASWGWRTAYIILGSGTGLMLLASSLIVRSPPRPDGTTRAANAEGYCAWAKDAEWEFDRAVRTSTFIIIAVIQFCLVTPVHIVSTHLVRFAELNGIERSVASAAWGLVGGISIAGRVIVPTVAERTIGWTRAITICGLSNALVFIWLLGVDSIWKLYPFVLIYGFFYGGKVPLIPATIRYYFGDKALGRLNGLSHAFSLMGGASGAVMAGYIVDVTGSYSAAFMVCAGLWATAAVLAWRVTPARRRESEGHRPAAKSFMHHL